MTNTLLFNRYASPQDLIDHLKKEVSGQDTVMEKITGLLVTPMHPTLRPCFKLIAQGRADESANIAQTVAKAIGANYIHVTVDQPNHDRALTTPLKTALEDYASSKAAPDTPVVIGIQNSRSLIGWDSNILFGLIHTEESAHFLTASQGPAAVFLIDENSSILYPEHEPLIDRTLSLKLSEPKV